VLGGGGHWLARASLGAPGSSSKATPGAFEHSRAFSGLGRAFARHPQQLDAAAFVAGRLIKCPGSCPGQEQ
jgi:hypothetical protein